MQFLDVWWTSTHKKNLCNVLWSQDITSLNKDLLIRNLLLIALNVSQSVQVKLEQVFPIPLSCIYLQLWMKFLEVVRVMWTCLCINMFQFGVKVTSVGDHAMAQLPVPSVFKDFYLFYKLLSLSESLYRSTTSVAEMVLQRDANIHLFIFEVYSLVERINH